jgi:UDPglucose 6-dehydrogenase
MSVAAARRGFVPVPETEIDSAELVFVAQDVATDSHANRLYSSLPAFWGCLKPVILCSQVVRGFCRRQELPDMYHQPETLRIIDATDRAYSPECIVVGCADPKDDIPKAYQTYLDAFQCPIVKTDYETAEFSKIAINMYLASQVDTTNRLAEAAKKCGANWDAIKLAVGYDKRIGTYTTPGRWQDSIHLLRDYVTLKEIEDAR